MIDDPNDAAEKAASVTEAEAKWGESVKPGRFQIQRPVLYLGEINDSEREAWCRVVEAFDEEAPAWIGSVLGRPIGGLARRHELAA